MLGDDEQRTKHKYVTHTAESDRSIPRAKPWEVPVLRLDVGGGRWEPSDNG